MLLYPVVSTMLVTLIGFFLGRDGGGTVGCGAGVVPFVEPPLRALGSRFPFVTEILEVEFEGDR